VDIIRTAYYIRGLELMKLIFAVLDVSWTMGLTRRYKTEGFFTFISIYKRNPKHGTLNLGRFTKWTMIQQYFDSHVSPCISVVTQKHFTISSSAKFTFLRPVYRSADSEAVSVWTHKHWDHLQLKQQSKQVNTWASKVL